MKITILTVGKIKEKYLRDAIAEYSKRLSRYAKLEIIEVADEKTPDTASEPVATNIKDTLGVQGTSHIIFVIGGSLGLGEEVLKRSNYALSFSKMTFPHQLMRVILLEQIYRSYRINCGEPYHK